MTDISIIIPSYNHPEKIFECVNTILSQKIKTDFEIIIVDSSNESNQSKIENLRSIDKRIKLVFLDNQTFPGTARNIGINKAEGNIIALIDADCAADENWLNSIVENIEENTILTGVIKNGTEGDVYGTCSYLVEFNNFLEFNKPKREIEAAATCNFAAHKSVFTKIGGFTDDRAFEDFLFCYKFKKSGGKIYQLNNIIITHNNKTNLKEIVQNQKMLGRFSAIVRNNYDMPPKIIFKYPILAFGLAAYRYYSITSRIVKTKNIFKFIAYTPVIVYLLLKWSQGFYLGAKKG